MEINKIIYYSDNSSMGETSEDDCNSYRSWALKELKSRYPNHDVSVSDQPSTMTVYTDDLENETEIQEFSHSLWDYCPWDFIDACRGGRS